VELRFLRPLAAVAALVIAYSMATLGEAVLGRWSRTVLEWNLSFLVGLSLTSTIFFPLSLVLHGNALNVTAGGLVFTGLFSGVRRVFKMRKGSARRTAALRGSTFAGLVPKVLLALVVLAVVQFTVENYRIIYYWDGYQIWATKAMVLDTRGALTQELLTPHEPDLVSFPGCCDPERVAAYPQTVPLFEALVAKVEGRFNWEAMKAVFPFFYVSMLISTFQAARVFVPPAAALGACAILALTPAVSTGLVLGGYADMPQAALVAGALAALFYAGDSRLPTYRRAAPWLLGGMLLVKSEGEILFGVACAAILMVWASRGTREMAASVRQNAGAIGLVAACAVLRRAYLAWMVTPGTVYGPFDKAHFALALQRLWLIPSICAHFMFSQPDWGIFWPVFAVALPVLFWKGGARERALACAVVAMIAMDHIIFYFSNKDIAVLIEQSYTRLLVQLAPAAVLVSIIGYQYVVAGKLNAEQAGAE
jgi:hypothetical protein